jgi:hypothetical protein
MTRSGGAPCLPDSNLGLWANLWPARPSHAPRAALDRRQLSPLEGLCLALALYQGLPQLLPKATVEFVACLGERKVKDVELCNPWKKQVGPRGCQLHAFSRRGDGPPLRRPPPLCRLGVSQCGTAHPPSWPARPQVTFQARLEGHKDFSLDAALVKLEPRACTRLQVACAPSTALPREARLIVAPYRDPGAGGGGGGGSGSSPAGTLVFLLQSSVDTLRPLKQLAMSSPLYELAVVELPVANPFPAGGRGSPCGWAARSWPPQPRPVWLCRIILQEGWLLGCRRACVPAPHLQTATWWCRWSTCRWCRLAQASRPHPPRAGQAPGRSRPRTSSSWATPPASRPPAQQHRPGHQALAPQPPPRRPLAQQQQQQQRVRPSRCTRTPLAWTASVCACAGTPGTSCASPSCPSCWGATSAGWSSGGPSPSRRLHPGTLGRAAVCAASSPMLLAAYACFE